MCKIMEKLLFFGLLFLVHQTVAENVIYKLTREEYSRMPPKNHLDRFNQCLLKPNAVYCTAHADLVSDGPSELLDMMRGYSAHYIKHFNYTNVIYGLCVKETCRPFYNGSDDEADLRVVAEACLNRSFSEEYGLKTRVTELNCYFENKSNFTVDWVDWLFAVLMLSILVLNAVGTVYDIYRDQTKPSNFILMSFSLRENWKQLVAPASTDPNMVLLRPINGIRVITSILVIMGHIPLPLMVGVDNPSWKENAYEMPVYHILLHGHLITLTFFLISGFLLTYNMEIQAEKEKLKWTVLPNAIFNRWLRLTPINAVALLIASSWMKFTSSGPLWQEIIGAEVHDCRNYWFYNLFYINNINDHSQCILQTWYLACDMHLHIVGLMVILLAPSAKARWWSLGALYTLGMAWTSYNIYSLDLDGTLLATPTAMSYFFIKNPTFNWVYKRTYANMPMFVMGMAFGYLVYDWNKKNIFARDLTKYRFLYWMLFPLAVLLVTTAGYLYFTDGPRASLGMRIAFGPIVKPLFVTLMVLLMLGAMFKIENFQRSIMEWSGWVPLSRISYCVYEFHVCIIRCLGGTRSTLAHFSLAHLAQDYCGTTAITFQLALVFYLFVEAPFARLTKKVMAPSLKPQTAIGDIAVNGAVNGAAIDAAAVDGAAVNGTKVNGAAVSCNVLNGGAVNETALTGTEINGHTLTEQITTEFKDKDA